MASRQRMSAPKSSSPTSRSESSRPVDLPPGDGAAFEMSAGGVTAEQALVAACASHSSLVLVGLTTGRRLPLRVAAEYS